MQSVLLKPKAGYSKHRKLHAVVMRHAHSKEQLRQSYSVTCRMTLTHTDSGTALMLFMDKLHLVHDLLSQQPDAAGKGKSERAVQEPVKDARVFLQEAFSYSDADPVMRGLWDTDSTSQASQPPKVVAERGQMKTSQSASFLPLTPQTIRDTCTACRGGWRPIRNMDASLTNTVVFVTPKRTSKQNGGDWVAEGLLRAYEDGMWVVQFLNSCHPINKDVLEFEDCIRGYAVFTCDAATNNAFSGIPGFAPLAVQHRPPPLPLEKHARKMTEFRRRPLAAVPSFVLAQHLVAMCMDELGFSGSPCMPYRLLLAVIPYVFGDATLFPSHNYHGSRTDALKLPNALEVGFSEEAIQEFLQLRGISTGEHVTTKALRGTKFTEPEDVICAALIARFYGVPYCGGCVQMRNSSSLQHTASVHDSKNRRLPSRHVCHQRQKRHQQEKAH